MVFGQRIFDPGSGFVEVGPRRKRRRLSFGVRLEPHKKQGTLKQNRHPHKTVLFTIARVFLQALQGKPMFEG